MMKTNKKVLWIFPCLLILAGIILLLLYMKISELNGEATWEDFEISLRGKEKIVDGVIYDKSAYTLISREGRLDYGDFFVVFEQKNKEWKRIYENNFDDLKPWKIAVADIDGDGVKEILTAVSKTTYFDTTEKNRMFIFNYEDNILTKKWTGSQIAGSWVDFNTGDLISIPGSELIFTSETETGEEYLSIFYWFDFGFQLLAESGIYQDIRSLSILDENRIQITYEIDKVKETATLTVKDGRIIEADLKQ